MDLLDLLILPLLLAAIFGCRTERAALREGNLALRELDKRDRQEVARAIRERRATKDPRQAEAVVVWARSLSGPG